MSATLQKQDYDRLQLLANLIAEHHLRWYPGPYNRAQDWVAVDDWARKLLRAEGREG